MTGDKRIKSLLSQMQRTSRSNQSQTLNNTSLQFKKQHLKTKYRLYMKQRQYHSQNDQKVQQECISKTDELKIPKIRSILNDRQQIRNTLRQTLNRYSYIKNENQKRMKEFNRRQKKYQNIIKIRQTHQIEKMQLKKSKVLLQELDLKQKQKSRSVVVSEQKKLQQSQIKMVTEKKNLASQLREQKKVYRQSIAKKQRLIMNKNKIIHSQILLQDEQLKKKKQEIRERNKRMLTQQHYKKLEKQIENNQRSYELKNRQQRRIKKQLLQLQKSKQNFERKIHEYQMLLKEKISKKIPNNQKIQFSLTTGLALSQDI